MFEERTKKLVKMLNVEEKLHVPVRKLSLGERVKFELICALLHSPKILFLDEPALGLDIVSQYAIDDFLKEINQKEKTTILLTSHYMKDIETLVNIVEFLWYFLYLVLFSFITYWMWFKGLEKYKSAN